MVKTVSVKEITLELDSKPTKPTPAGWNASNVSHSGEEYGSALIEHLNEVLKTINELEKKGYVLVLNPFSAFLSSRQTMPNKIVFRMEHREPDNKAEHSRPTPATPSLLRQPPAEREGAGEEISQHTEVVRNLTYIEIAEMFGFPNPDKLLVGHEECTNLLSVRTFNCLINGKIKYIGEMIQLNEQQYFQIKNFGRKSLNEIKDWLKNEFGFEIGMRIPVEVITWCKLLKPDFKYF